MWESVWLHMDRTSDHWQKKSTNQYFFPGLGGWGLAGPNNMLLCCLSSEPIGSQGSETLPGDRPSQAPALTPAPSRAPAAPRSAASAAAAELLALLMAIVMNEDLCSWFFIGRLRAGRWMAATSPPLSGRPRRRVQDWWNKVGGMALRRGAKRVRGSRKTDGREREWSQGKRASETKTAE